MNSKLWIRNLTLVAVILMAAAATLAQSRANQLSRPCPGSTTPATVRITSAGGIVLSPCSGQTVTPSSGLTSGSVLFAGASGVLSQNNAAFNWLDSTRFTVTTSSESSGTSALGAMALSFNGYPGSVYSSGLVISSTNASAFFPTHLVLRNGAYATEGTISTSDASNGIRFSGPRTGAGTATFTFNHATSGSPFAATFSSDTAVPAFKLTSGGAAQTIQQIQTAAAQTANAFEIRNSSSALLSGADQLGRTFGSNGAAVASAAAIVPSGNLFHVTGTTTITSITSTNVVAGTCITIIFDGALTFTDGSNLKLAGNFVTTADDTISLCYDGTNWYETARAVN